MTTKHKKIFAFSLVELMAAVTVVSILVALALPRFRLFIATSRQAEAHANLGIIASLQQSYYLEHNTYHQGMLMGKGGLGGVCGNSSAAEQNQLGFRVTNCDELRYTYKSGSSTGDCGSAPISCDFAGNRLSVEPSIYPNCYGKKEYWVITKGRKIKHPMNGNPTEYNAIAQCSQ